MDKYSNQAIRVQESLAFLNFGQGFIFSAALTAVMYMASGGIVTGTLTLGDLVMINGLLFQLSLPLNFLGTVYRELKQAIVDMDVLFSISMQEPEIKNFPNAAPLQLKGGEITFQNVKFSYDHDKPILNDLSFTIPKGSRVAIVGTSGGGKTSILRLLFRFYDPWSGRVQIDGQDIRYVTLESLRQAISVVPQDLLLFNDTILYNITYGSPGASVEEVERCARLAHIHETILKMPKGYDTIVGERGLKLSGGEKQRICLARALMKNPEILILDEATSGLDAESENAIQKAIEECTRGRTVLMISHRLKTIQSADKILVLHQGQVIEEGSHSELMSISHGIYASFVQHQQLKT